MSVSISPIYGKSGSSSALRLDFTPPSDKQSDVFDSVEAVAPERITVVDLDQHVLVTPYEPEIHCVSGRRLAGGFVCIDYGSNHDFIAWRDAIRFAWRHPDSEDPAVCDESTDFMSEFEIFS